MMINIFEIFKSKVYGDNFINSIIIKLIMRITIITIPVFYAYIYVKIC